MPNTPINKPLQKWNKVDTDWTLSIYGTAIGAGILFLPIQLGLGGLLPVLIMTIIAFPIAFLPARNVARVILAAKNDNDDIIDVTKQNFSKGFTNFFAFAYFLCVFPILMIYGVALTNNIINVMVELLGWSSPSRWWLALLIVSSLILSVSCSRIIVLKIMSFLVFPLIAALFLFSLAIIPYWNYDILNTLSFSYVSPIETHNNLFKALLVSLPIIAVAFNHIFAISSFVSSNREMYGKNAERKILKTQKLAISLMVFTSMFFVFSCIMALSPKQLEMAKIDNISVLDSLAIVLHNPIIKYIASGIAFVAVASSFLGHYLGAQESFKYFFTHIYKPKTMRISDKTIQLLTAITMFIAIWLAATYNPSIIATIANIIGPMIAFILFLFPLIAIYTIPQLYKYKSLIPDLFIALIGVACMYIAIVSLL
ncbi:aromatic amino acid transport family protein [Bartonella sp. DGB1]|uniref:aromatic amino acid transport family protein n=1 Tax=Bartonella sp. DGB1 TaxID=3239807 RepID=UPI0035247625